MTSDVSRNFLLENDNNIQPRKQGCIHVQSIRGSTVSRIVFAKVISRRLYAVMIYNLGSAAVVQADVFIPFKQFSPKYVAVPASN